MNFSSTSKVVLRAMTFALLGALTLAPFAASPALAQYYDDDDYNQTDDGSRNYDNRESYDRGSSQSYWDADNETDDPDVSFFYDELAGDGRWISHRDYGLVWSPNGVDDDWRPYTRGNWVNTDEHGWYWVSEENFGWATYHYGRWFFDDRHGWLWVPGSTWGPAWVAWRSSDSYVGWAPLPPEASWDARSGLRYDAALYEEPRFSAYWSFVEPRYISTPNIYRYCAPRHRARTIIYSTRPQTRYDYRGDRVVNFGISVNFFERFLGSPLRSVRVFATESRNARGFDRRAGDTIRVWRPDFHRQYQAARPRGERPWGTGVWRNVDRHASRGGPPPAPPRAAPQGRPWIPGFGLPSVGREARPAPGEGRKAREWDGDDNRRDFGRGREGAPPRDVRPANPAYVPQRPPVATTTPPPSRGDRPDRGRDGGGGRPDRGDGALGPRPSHTTTLPPYTPPAAAPAPLPAPVATPPVQRPDRGNWTGGDRPRGARDAAQPPAKLPPPVAATPPAGPTGQRPKPKAAAQPPANVQPAEEAPPAIAGRPPPRAGIGGSIPGVNPQQGVLPGGGRPY